MDTFDRPSLQRLIAQAELPCMSLFMPTHPAGRDTGQDSIRLKNLLVEANRELAGHWVSDVEARAFVARAEALADDASFWPERAQGLAIFQAQNFLQAFRVPVALAEHVSISDRFRVRPILPLLERNQSIFLLTLSENRVALYSVDEHSIGRIDVPNLPETMTGALNYTGADRGAQLHSAGQDVVGKQGAVFHGQGGKPDTRKDDQAAFCSQIDKAVTAWLGASTTPLLLACVESLGTLYRSKSRYRHVLRETLAGNHDHESEHELQRGAWPIAERLLTSESHSVFARYGDRLGVGLSVDDLSAVVASAIEGRVESLLYDPKAELFGKCSDTEGIAKVTGKENDDDLIDLAAVETLRHGGSIHSMTGRHVPTNAPLAAILRY